MANINQKNGVFHIRFRYGGQQYKKSLKTTNQTDAEMALRSIERAIHNLTTGVLQVPENIDAGDFIVSGGTLRQAPRKRKVVPSLKAVIGDYLTAQYGKADSTVDTERTHLRHLERALPTLLDKAVDKVTRRHLEQHLQARAKLRAGETVSKERMTLIQLFRWCVRQEYLDASPADALPKPKGSVERDPFKTVAEVKLMIERGGLSEEDAFGLWESIYLTVEEITGLLKLVRERASSEVGRLLHLIPAYTGMRRGEILRLRWRDVNLQDGFLVARSLKQSRKKHETTREIDLHPELKAELDDYKRRRPHGQHVICDEGSLEPLEPGVASKAFWQPLRGTEWCLNARRKCYKIGFHTYRHSFASNMAAKGVDQRIIDTLMGHQTEGMRKRYRHLFPKLRRSAVEYLSFAGKEGDAAPEAGNS